MREKQDERGSYDKSPRCHTEQKSSDQKPALPRGFHCLLQTVASLLWSPSPKSGTDHHTYHHLPGRPLLPKPQLKQFLAYPAIATHNTELGM